MLWKWVHRMDIFLVRGSWWRLLSSFQQDKLERSRLRRSQSLNDWRSKVSKKLSWMFDYPWLRTQQLRSHWMHSFCSKPLQSSACCRFWLLGPNLGFLFPKGFQEQATGLKFPIWDRPWWRYRVRQSTNIPTSIASSFPREWHTHDQKI